MIVTVTQEHIDKGVRGECSLCPVALALNDTAGPFWSAGVFYLLQYDNDSCFGRPEAAIRFVETPRDVKRFMDDIDSGKRRRPFSFEIPDD